MHPKKRFKGGPEEIPEEIQTGDQSRRPLALCGLLVTAATIFKILSEDERKI